MLPNTLVVYESRYGSTQEVAEFVAMVLGPSRSVKVDEFKDEYRDFDLFVIGSPIYNDAVAPSIYRFVKNNAIWLKDKKVALFCLSLSGEDGFRYLQPLRDLLGNNVVLSSDLGGRLVMEELSPEDRETIIEFCSAHGLSPEDADLFERSKVVDFALQVRELRGYKGPEMPREELRSVLEGFLKEHNTCTLCTCRDGEVRGSPVEYRYRDGRMFIISEGGEKFANILLNERVAVCVYDPYTGIGSLGGVQMRGRAAVIAPGSPEYREEVERSGYSYGRISGMKIVLNLIRVELMEAELLLMRLKHQGYDPRQVYRFI